MKQITIVLEPEARLSVSGEISFPEAMQGMFSAILTLMNNVLDQTTEEERDQIQGEIYDMVNHAAGVILDKFQPEPTNAADVLTAEAIMKAENELLDSK